MNTFLEKIKFLLKKQFISLTQIKNKQDTILLNLGKLQIERIKKAGRIDSLSDVEFKVYSQFGEDGIIQYLISRIEIPEKTFVEFGIQDYSESNTRFLLINDNWKGLVIDCSDENIRYVKSDAIYWKYNLTAVNSFITKDNINTIISENIGKKDIGLLSIDIDGNDYWIWETIDVIHPRIVVCEYNSLFGKDKAVSVPYDKSFDRSKKHFSNLYFGASLAALCSLAEKKGYDFVGSNSAGSNAFFVRKDLSSPFKHFDAASGYVRIQSRQSRDQQGNLTFLSGNEELNVMSDMPLVNLQDGSFISVRDLI